MVRSVRGAFVLAAVAALAAPILWAGCSNNSFVAAPRSFDRPDALALVCFEDGVPAALSRCVVINDDGDLREGARLHALIAQTTRGEVAAVDLSTGAILDSDVRVPGFTFVPVGEVPTEIIVPPSDPRYTYVANRGSGSLLSLVTQDFRDGSGLAPRDELLLPSGSLPTAMIGTPDESALIVALPERGQLAKVAIADGRFGEVELLSLSSEVPEAVDLSALDEASQPPSYAVLGGAADPVLAAPILPPRTPIALDVHPRPWAFAVAEEGPDQEVLLVADAALPIIHRVDLRSFTEISSINVGVPTRDLALTPTVPTAEGDTFECAEAVDLPDGAGTRCIRRECVGAGCQRYLYAIDEVDGTVLAVDYTEPGVSDPAAAARFGAVLPISSGINGPSDRITGFNATARAIEVLTPGAENEGCGDNPAPANLQGIFLTLAMADGTVRFIDVWDREIDCRVTSANENTGSGERVYLQRHRPRISNALTSGVEVTEAPSFSVGASTDEGEPHLGAVTCPEGLSPVLSNDSGTLICAVTDPWSTRGESWTVVYEGVIPFASTTGGNFVEGLDAIDARVDFCGLGVLGSEDLGNLDGLSPEEEPLVGYAGDLLVITSGLPPDGEERLGPDAWEICVELVGGDAEIPLEVELPIRSALSNPDDITPTYNGRLVLGTTPTRDTINDDGVQERSPIRVANGSREATLDDVRSCFSELVTFEIRSQRAFVVSSSRAGATHRISRNETTGACEVDLSLDPRLRMRAFYRRSFETSLILFRIDSEPAGASTADPEMRFTVGNIPSRLGVDLGAPSFFGGSRQLALPSRLLFNPTDGDLYAVDQAQRGLVELGLAPLSIQRSFE